jgi:hypothetical protein
MITAAEVLSGRWRLSVCGLPRKENGSENGPAQQTAYLKLAASRNLAVHSDRPDFNRGTQRLRV